MSKRAKPVTDEGTLVTVRMLANYHDNAVADLMAKVERLEKFVSALVKALPPDAAGRDADMRWRAAQIERLMDKQEAGGESA